MNDAASGVVVRLGIAVAVLLAGGCTSSQTGTTAPTVPGSASGNDGSPTAGASFPAPGNSRLPADEIRALQAVLTGVVSDYGLTHEAGAPGITAAVLSDPGSWAGAAGTGGDGARLTPDAMMAIGGITITFVAADVMRLAAKGKVNLDAPLSTYIPSSLTGNGATVRQTLSMRGGLIDPPASIFEALVATQRATPGKRWTVLETLTYLKPHLSAPGGAPAYAKTSYLLLGLLIEKITGRRVAQVERADLFTPAGLRRIVAQDAERPTPPLAVPARRVNATTDGYLPYRVWARLGNDSFTGIAADAMTVATWGYQLYGSRLLPAESVRAMTSQPSTENIVAGIGYGLGTMDLPGLSTDAAYGHLGQDPGYTALLAVLPARRLAAVVLIPEENRSVETIMRDLLAVRLK
jgi:D-alanyl-D-alanine carboxypeptidase